ncbi:triose-phosphate transporter family-domain-containing protein [Naematelia encephala]|uniref:Triose-phosphate transporter family-domain-containing protein n=1 Tax=Naematelia encephala TaxID=71784 RepID=A0A1Y2B0C1_9TREE|nr:triose-phosphate transporter family-domain-containing protein [Naematelia encephala]
MMEDTPGPSQSRLSLSSPPQRVLHLHHPKARTSNDTIRPEGTFEDDDPPLYAEAPRLSHDENERDGDALLGDGGYKVSEDGLGLYSNGHARASSDGGRVQEAATLQQRKALWWKDVTVTGIFIMSWYCFATLLSLYNKWMFSPQYYNFPYPLFVTFCHMCVQFLLAAFIRWTFPVWRPPERPSRQEYVAKILPTAASTGGDIGLSNLSLKTISLSLYTMCKSSTLIFVLVFAFLFRLEVYSLRLISVISLISFGVFLMVFNTTSVSIPGIIMVFSASGLAGLRWALTELVMHKRGMGMSNPFATIFWLAPLMAVTLGVVSMIMEGWITVLSTDFFSLEDLRVLKTIGVIALPGAVAFAMVASEYAIISRAGSVPMSIAGIFKEVSTISISAWVFGDQLTELNIIGVVITVLGISLYSYHKYQKSVTSPQPLDSHGKPLSLSLAIPTDDTSPLVSSSSSNTIQRPYPYSTSSQSGQRGASQEIEQQEDNVPLAPLVRRTDESEQERAVRLRDEFEGWNESRSWSEEDGEEVDEDEVARRREDRENAAGPASASASSRGGGGKSKSWGTWWDSSM